MMKAPFSSKPADKKARYQIEKAFNRKIKTHYDAINHINKQASEITEDAETTFEKAERAHIKNKQTLETSFEKKITQLKDKQASELATISQSIKTLNHASKEQLKSLELDFKKSLILLEDDIKSLEEDHKLKNKEIEKKHLNNSATYKEKLSLYQDNLKKNQTDTQDHIQTSLNTLQDLLDKSTKQNHTSYLACKENLDALKTTLDKLLQSDLDTATSITKNATYTMNTLRKNLNIILKDVTSSITSTRNALEVPMNALIQSFKSLKEHLQTNKKDTIDKIEYDFNNVKKRLEKRINDTTTKDTPKDKKDYQARLKLASQRKDALIKQYTTIQTYIHEEIHYAENLINDNQTMLTTAFENQEDALKTHQTKIKDLFAVIEDYLTTAAQHHESLTQRHHMRSSYQTITNTIESCFDNLLDFQKERIETHISYTNNIAPLIKESDDLTFDLDTIEAKKEIEINNQKMIIEQENAALRFNMRKSKILHDKDMMSIKHKTRVKKQEALNTIKLNKEIEQRDNLIASHKHDIKSLEIELKIALSKAVFDLRKNHIDKDITIAKHKIDLETEKLEIEKQIKCNTLEKDIAIEATDLEKEATEKTLKHTYEIKNTKQSLNLTLEKKHKQQKQENINLESKKEAIIASYEEQQRKLENDINTRKEAYEKQKEFIHRALEKETAQPIKNISDIKDMIAHRLRQINDYTHPLSDALKTYNATLNDQEATLKSLLFIVALPFENTITNWIQTIIDVELESIHFVHELQKKHIENDTTLTDRKKHNHLQKTIQEYDKQKTKIEKQQKQLIKAYTARIQDTKSRIKKLDKPTLKTIRALTKTLFGFIQDTHQDELKHIIDHIKAIFTPLYEADQALVHRAKENHEKAQAQAKVKFEDALKPLQNAYDAIEAQQDEALKKCENAHQETLIKRLEPIEKQLTSLRAHIQDLENQKNTITKSIEEKQVSLEAEKKAAIEQIENEYTVRSQAFTNQKQKTLDKLNTQLVDTQNILDYEQKMHQADLENIENIKSETLHSNAQNNETTTLTLQNTLKQLDKDEETDVQKSKNTFEDTNDNYKHQILTGASRLETLIENATRKVEQEATLKKQRLQHLNHTITTLQETLHQSITVAFKHLTNSLDSLELHTFTLTDESTQHLNAFKESSEHFIDQLIKKTIKDIHSKD